jgi:hypothetical protein
MSGAGNAVLTVGFNELLLLATGRDCKKTARNQAVK